MPQSSRRSCRLLAPPSRDGEIEPARHEIPYTARPIGSTIDEGIPVDRGVIAVRFFRFALASSSRDLNIRTNRADIRRIGDH